MGKCGRARQATDDNIIRLRKYAIPIAIRCHDSSALNLAYVEYTVPVTQETGFTDEIIEFFVALIFNYLSLSSFSLPYFVFSFSLESSSSPFPIDTDWCELMTEIEGGLQPALVAQPTNEPTPCQFLALSLPPAAGLRPGWMV